MLELRDVWAIVRMNTSAIAQPSWLERRRMGKTAHRFGVMSAIGFGGSYYTMSAIERSEHICISPIRDYSLQRIHLECFQSLSALSFCPRQEVELIRTGLNGCQYRSRRLMNPPSRQQARAPL